MKKNIVEKVMADHSGLGEFVNGMEFLKEVHSLYKNLGGMKNILIAKGIIKYVTNENEIGWCYAVQFVFNLLEKIDSTGISSCKKNKENIDWEQACKMWYPKELNLIKPKTAFKDLFYLLAMNNDEDVENLLIEPSLDAYGWQKIVKSMVELYEEILSTNTEFAETVIATEEAPMDVKEDDVCSDTPIADEKTPIEEPKETISITTIENTDVETKESSIEILKPIENKKYARGRKIVLKCLVDDSSTEWTTPKEIEDAIGIPSGAIRKNVSGHSKYIRFNNKKYQASYKEAC